MSKQKLINSSVDILNSSSLIIFELVELITSAGIVLHSRDKEFCSQFDTKRYCEIEQREIR